MKEWGSFSLHLENILDRELARGERSFQIVGRPSPTLLSCLLSQSNSKQINELPHLIIVPSLAEAQSVKEAFAFFGRTQRLVILPAFDVSPYSGLTPKPQTAAQRIEFLYRAQEVRKGDVFICPISSLLQKTLPPQVLAQSVLKLKVEDELPEKWNEFLVSLGYQMVPTVEDVGTFSVRGGILDIFTPGYDHPLRLELFGDFVESIRFFSQETQLSLETISDFTILPAKEVLWRNRDPEVVTNRFLESLQGRQVEKEEREEIVRALTRSQDFPGLDFLLPYFYEKTFSVLDHFNSDLNIWWFDSMEISRVADLTYEELKSEHSSSSRQLIRPEIGGLYQTLDQILWPDQSRVFHLRQITVESADDKIRYKEIAYPTYSLNDLTLSLQGHPAGSEPWNKGLLEKWRSWNQEGYRVFLSVKNKNQWERLKLYLEKIEVPTFNADESHDPLSHQRAIGFTSSALPESVRLPDDTLLFLREDELLGKRRRSSSVSAQEFFHKRAKRLSFGDLRPGDHVVHVEHGVGVYEGLKTMSIQGVDSEFIQIGYRDRDKLYVPVYRVGQLQKYAGAAAAVGIDKLGGQQWEKTKVKVRSFLRDLAHELLKLYASRSEAVRDPFSLQEESFEKFQNQFPFEETEDQARAINDFVKDMSSAHPMDRLVCGDVGFGKTEVAMRAAFLAYANKKQVAVLAPTTVLTFQHLETFKKRFQNWPIEIRALNRFVPPADQKKTLKELKDGKVDILIGTHRLLSKDVAFQNLGLLIIDEEQKFGVLHKERIRKLKTSVDTMALSATPIPRTLNMSLMGIRDLSIINTPPMDRLPTRTFIIRFDEETIRKSILSEMKRGGQVYFIHNRIQSIYGLADEIRRIVPEARIRVGHGQMEEHELEETMIQFFKHEIDVLICTTIVESGMDVPRANTMFIDQAHAMGLSQLYQLRGRVGRSKQRAYCYLIVPKNKEIEKEAQERLRVIQENTALGSGIRVAQYDLELRGAGELLGENQSGHVNAVGYELYMDLLNETLAELKGEAPAESKIDPEINLRVPALIPDQYIPDIRVRLAYYKALADISTSEELDQIEQELRDQFGDIPEPTLNLFGLMLIRSVCKKLGVKDVSAGAKNVSLLFDESTQMKPETMIRLATKENKKYSITPDNRLNIRMNEIRWPIVYDELQLLLGFL